MARLRILISGAESEFAPERQALRGYLDADPLMRRFFELIRCKDTSASDRRLDELHLGEVERCDLYIGLFGNDYGTEDERGRSPTEREFDCATECRAHRLVFVKGRDDGDRHPKMRALIGKAQAGLL